MHFVHPVSIWSNQNYCIAYAFGRHTQTDRQKDTCTQAHTHTYKPSAKILPMVNNVGDSFCSIASVTLTIMHVAVTVADKWQFRKFLFLCY